jgi:cytochrome c peroxidase
MRALATQAFLRLLAVAFVCGGVAGGLGASILLAKVSAAQDIGSAVSGGDTTLAALKARFRRPNTVPFPADNPYSDDKRALGETLFRDPRLSADGTISCSSCHDRTKGFADGRARSLGVPKRPLARHTPTLWNLAWGRKMFWDGRARGLEDQVGGPVENPDEMAQPLSELKAKLSADPAYARAFAEAFSRDPRVTVRNIVKALATYERTLVSPRTRFDRWVDGDDTAMSAAEIAGFRLFAGKAGCANCHDGWTFTDSAYYDTGLPGEDRGRGAVLRVRAVEHAFKTPGLREVGRSAPYMHDGSLATLDDVIRHYEKGIVARPTLPVDLPRSLSLTETERNNLIAFLATLSAEQDPQPPAQIVAEISGEHGTAVPVSTVSQSEKAFHPARIRVKRGQRVWVVNNDTRTHNVRIFDPKMDVDSGPQEPGETVEIVFPQAGEFLMSCAIHPKMELWVDVAP